MLALVCRSPTKEAPLTLARVIVSATVPFGQPIMALGRTNLEPSTSRFGGGDHDDDMTTALKVILLPKS
jgi:hypothetical protein